MRVIIKDTWCAGELVVEDGSVTCIDNCACHSDELPMDSATARLLQPVIDWVRAQGGQTP